MQRLQALPASCFNSTPPFDSPTSSSPLHLSPHPLSGVIYHTKFKPAPADIAGRLTQRSDDTEEKVDSLLPLHRVMFFVQTLSSQVKVRVAAYHQNLKALTDTYKSVLVRINGDRKPDDIYKDVSKSIKGQ